MNIAVAPLPSNEDVELIMSSVEGYNDGSLRDRTLIHASFQIGSTRQLEFDANVIETQLGAGWKDMLIKAARPYSSLTREEEAMEAISRLEENSHQSDWQRDSDLRKLRAYVLSKQ